MAVGNDSDLAGYSLSVTLFVFYLKHAEWILHTGATYHVCPKRKWFASFRKLDGDLLTFNDGQTCQTEGIGTVCIKLFDEMIRELLKDVRYLS